MPRLPGLRPSRYASGLRGFSTGHPALAKNWPASLRATLRAFLHPPAAVIRGPQGQRAKSKEQRAKTKAKGQETSKEQRPKSKDQRAKSKEQRAKSKEQRAKSKEQRA